MGTGEQRKTRHRGTVGREERQDILLLDVLVMYAILRYQKTTAKPHSRPKRSIITSYSVRLHIDSLIQNLNVVPVATYDRDASLVL